MPQLKSGRCSSAFDPVRPLELKTPSHALFCTQADISNVRAWHDERKFSFPATQETPQIFNTPHISETRITAKNTQQGSVPVTRYTALTAIRLAVLFGSPRPL